MRLLELSLKVLGILSFLLVSPYRCVAQDLDIRDIITTVDFRGKSLDVAIRASVKITNNDYVVVLIKGGDKTLHEKIRGHLKALVQIEYDRIGLVLADLEANEQNPVIAIFSDGTLYAVVKQAKADLETGWKIYNLVKDAYQEHILPKLNRPNKEARSN